MEVISKMPMRSGIYPDPWLKNRKRIVAADVRRRNLLGIHL
jgi:hypothetical protein